MWYVGCVFLLCCIVCLIVMLNNAGKTTLLSCIVGLRKLTKGKIYVCGKKPGEKGSGLPGRLVGYMPQAWEIINF